MTNSRRNFDILLRWSEVIRGIVDGISISGISDQIEYPERRTEEPLKFFMR
jgi:hypothetical protein